MSASMCVCVFTFTGRVISTQGHTAPKVQLALQLTEHETENMDFLTKSCKNEIISTVQKSAGI